MSVSQVLESLNKVNDDIYLTEFSDGTSVSFCLPSHKDALRYASLLRMFEEDEPLKNIIFEHIFKKYALDDFVLVSGDLLPAGIISSVVGVMLHLSMVLDEPLEEVNVLLETYRTLSNNYISFMKRTICSVFPAYKISDVEVLNYQKLLEVFVSAERVLLDRGIIEKEYSVSIKEQEEVVDIGKMIAQDRKQYNNFETDKSDRLNY